LPPLALKFMAALTDPEVVSKAYGFLGSTYRWRPWKPEEVYTGAQITPVESMNDPEVIEALKQKPVLAFYLRKLPDLSSLPEQERNKIIAETIQWP